MSIQSHEPRSRLDQVMRDGERRFHPVSFAQHRLWFVDQLTPGLAFYTICKAVRLRGRLDVDALRAALDEVVRRHEVLRTAIAPLDGEPIQVVAPELRLALPVIDLGSLHAEERERRVLDLVAAEAATPFDLARGPLVRARLLRPDGDDHVLVLTFHHVVFDGASTGVLFRELSALYGAFAAGRPSPLPPLPLQFGDYALWQRDQLSGAALERELAYWRERLAGAPAVLTMPADRPRPAVETFRGATCPIELPPALAEALGALGRRAGTTPFMTLLAAFAALLGRHAGQDDVVVGAPIANRTRRELEDLIGFFANTLALRVDLSGDPTFSALLGRVRETTLGAYEHQDLPFERLVEELAPARDLSHNPVFQAMFAPRDPSQASLDLPGLACTRVPVARTISQFDLSLFLDLPGGGFLSYNTDLFEAATGERLAGRLLTLLAGSAADPDRRLSRVPILPDGERRRVLALGRGGSRAELEPPLAHRLFEATARARPDAVAVEWAGGRLTYGELEARANRLARALRERGVGPETRVGICLARGPRQVETLLAVLKAGAAFVSIEPDDPAERRRLVLADAAVALVVTERAMAGLAEGAAPLLDLDAEPELPAGPDPGPPPGGALPDNLAYVIYTSGSTGRPKGVAMSHRALCNLLAWQLASFAGPAPARTLQYAALSFDISLQEIFTTFRTGSTLVLLTEAERRDAGALLDLLTCRRVERIFLPFVGLRQVAEAAAGREWALDGLREVFVAGEQLRVDEPLAAWLRRQPGCVLHNHYGATESHVVTALTLTGDPANWPEHVPIGRPIDNVAVHVLDEALEPAPAGVAGEVCIGGVQLARGYLGRPDLTAERFVPDPLAGRPGARMYRTGDVGRVLPDGAIAFLGRADLQVKVRGFRVEPGEVEAALLRHPAVAEVAVLAPEDSPGERRLVAFAALRPGEDAAGPAELRAFLKAGLPEYMVPSAIAVLDELPHTSGNKVDRRALAALEAPAPVAEATVAPRTPVEVALAEIWAEVLGREGFGVDDDFFDLGGHSLRATQVTSRVRRRLGVQVSLRAFFQAPTLAAMAAAVEAARTSGGER